jgi:shikimate kinase
MQQKGKNIVLIGMPGVGKSTVGVLLAKRLGFAFVDTDIYLQTQEGRRLQEIIEHQGIAGFCKLEERYVRSLSGSLAGGAHVIATGGSVVYKHETMQDLEKAGIIIYLALALENLKTRLSGLDARGVVRAPGQSIDTLFDERGPLYLRYANLTVDCNGLDPEQVVGAIIKILPGQIL